MTAAPSQIGGYELLIPIGTGGMGTVYLARRQVVEGVSREFAVKLLHPQLQKEPGVAQQLIEEAQLAATIHHPNVVRVVAAESVDDGVYLAMDYVEGDTLSGLLRAANRDREPIPLPVITRIMIDALAGLHAAHEARREDGTPLGLVHRDFSPQNLLVGVDGVTRLADFGIAKAISRISSTATGIVKGKVGYMAPEQALGKQLDRRCDVWAAGVVLWETLTSRRLFSADTDAATILELVSGADPPPASSFRSGVPAAVDELLLRVLQRDRDARLGSADELASQLRHAWQPLGIADASEVASYVRRAAGDQLAHRRQQLASLKQGVGSLPTRAEALTAMPTETTTTSVTAPAHVPGRRNTLLVAAALMAALAIAVATMWPPTNASRMSPALAPTVEVTAPAASGTAVPTASATPSVVMLVVEANEPVAQLRIGKDQPIILPVPATSFRIPLPPDHEGSELVASTRDGRHQTATLHAGRDRVEITFAPRKMNPVRRRRTRRSSDDNRLAPEP